MRVRSTKLLMCKSVWGSDVTWTASEGLQVEAVIAAAEMRKLSWREAHGWCVGRGKVLQAKLELCSQARGVSLFATRSL